ncbi:MAG: aminotransferase class V-fold PLP-dependent enzyme [Planctomycetota bacterium]|jgi:cysteine desulfurase/selenocysteine lyase|nr:aminotransferase class V-fold PLP-dependent enzyme [Planctomycetota bacterium]
MQLNTILADPVLRAELFPVTAERIYMAHAGVAPLSGPAQQALVTYANRGAVHSQERGWIWQQVADLRAATAELLAAQASEVALLGPTALGLNLVALGTQWRAGDEVIYHGADYPANVYPWLALADRGVKPVPLSPEQPGVITPDLVLSAVTERTRLVSLASCHYLSGYRIDIDAIGSALQERDIRFCVDGIQTLGAFPTSTQHVDYLAADSHKWLLGPCGAGVFWCREERFADLKPPLLGAWNVDSPEFVAQDHIDLVPGAQRFEPGTLNLPGVVAMVASMRCLLQLGVPAIAARLLHLRAYLLEPLRAAGWEPILGELEDASGADSWRSAIVTLRHPSRDGEAVFQTLLRAGVVASLRHDPAGQAWLRLSPHAYLSEADCDRVIELLTAA